MKATVDDEQLTLQLQGWEKFFGLKNKLVIPKNDIVSIEWHPLFEMHQRLWRTMGTGIPGALYAGHFRAKGERYFLYLHQPHGIAWVQGTVIAQNTLVITVNNYPYTYIVMSCEPEISRQLITWWQGI